MSNSCDDNHYTTVIFFYIDVIVCSKVCVCVCVCVNACICLCAHVCFYVCIFEVCVCVCERRCDCVLKCDCVLCLCVWLCIWMYMYMSVCLCKYVCAWVCAYLCMYMCVYMYVYSISLVWFGLLCFYGILTTGGYLMPNPFDTYQIYDSERHCVDNILKQAWAHFLHSVKWFHLFLSNTNISICYKYFVCTQLNAFKYCYFTLTIQLNISRLFTHS